MSEGVAWPTMETPDNLPLPVDLEKLFQEARPELEAVDPAQFVRRLVLRARVVELTDITLRSWMPLVEQLDELLTPNVTKQRKAELEQLNRRAWIFYAADLAAEELRADTGRLHQRAMAKIVAEHDRFLFKWATPMFAEHPVHGPTLRDISRGAGRRDDAEDVLRLVALFRDQWNAVKDQLPAVTAERLDQAAADATEQLASLAGSGASPLRKLADAAYALWYRDYDELIALGRYMSRREPDALERFPGVRSLVTRRSNEELDPELDSEGEGEGEGEGDAVAAVLEDPNAAA
jgi:hypothetical protein